MLHYSKAFLCPLARVVPQAAEVVAELVGGPVDAPNRQHEGLSETDVLVERLYALNIIAQAGFQPALELWQVGWSFSARPACEALQIACMCPRAGEAALLPFSGETAVQTAHRTSHRLKQHGVPGTSALSPPMLLQEPGAPPIIPSGSSPLAFTSPALSCEQQQQLTADLQVRPHRIVQHCTCALCRTQRVLVVYAASLIST